MSRQLRWSELCHTGKLSSMVTKTSEQDRVSNAVWQSQPLMRTVPTRCDAELKVRYLGDETPAMDPFVT